MSNLTSSPTVESAHPNILDIDPFDVTWVLSPVAVWITTVLSTFVIIYSIQDTREHSLHFTRPTLQRLTMRIQLMVPIYATFSVLCLHLPENRFALATIRDTYESFVLYEFLALLIAYCGGEGQLIHALQLKRYKGEHPFPCCCLPLFPLDRDFFLRCKRWVLQYALLKPITSAIAVIGAMNGTYRETDFDWATNLFPYFTIINNVSISYSLWYLVVFHNETERELAYCRPMLKFICIKTIIFFAYWQGLVVNFMAQLGILFIGHEEKEREEVFGAAQDFLICMELIPVAIMHHYAFGYESFKQEMKDEPVFERIEGGYTRKARNNNNNNNPKGGQNNAATVHTDADILDAVEKAKEMERLQVQQRFQKQQQGSLAAKLKRMHSGVNNNNSNNNHHRRSNSQNRPNADFRRQALKAVSYNNNNSTRDDPLGGTMNSSSIYNVNDDDSEMIDNNNNYNYNLQQTNSNIPIDYSDIDNDDGDDTDLENTRRSSTKNRLQNTTEILMSNINAVSNSNNNNTRSSNTNNAIPPETPFGGRVIRDPTTNQEQHVTTMSNFMKQQQQQNSLSIPKTTSFNGTTTPPLSRTNSMRSTHTTGTTTKTENTTTATSATGNNNNNNKSNLKNPFDSILKFVTPGQRSQVQKAQAVEEALDAVETSVLREALALQDFVSDTVQTIFYQGGGLLEAGANNAGGENGDGRKGRRRRKRRTYGGDSSSDDDKNAGDVEYDPDDENFDIDELYNPGGPRFIDSNKNDPFGVLGNAAATGGVVDHQLASILQVIANEQNGGAGGDDSASSDSEVEREEADARGAGWCGDPTMMEFENDGEFPLVPWYDYKTGRRREVLADGSLQAQQQTQNDGPLAGTTTTNVALLSLKKIYDLVGDSASGGNGDKNKNDEDEIFCTVCGRNDREMVERSNGWKCIQCVGRKHQYFSTPAMAKKAQEETNHSSSSPTVLHQKKKESDNKSNNNHADPRKNLSKSAYDDDEDENEKKKNQNDDDTI